MQLFNINYSKKRKKRGGPECYPRKIAGQCWNGGESEGKRRKGLGYLRKQDHPSPSLNEDDNDIKYKNTILIWIRQERVRRNGRQSAIEGQREIECRGEMESREGN